MNSEGFVTEKDKQNGHEIRVAKDINYTSLVEEILSNKPNFLLRNGISILFFCVVFIVFVCCFISYPDIIRAKATLTTLNAPKAVLSKTAGKIIMLNAYESKAVNKGDLLGYVETLGNHETILNLFADIDSIEKKISTEQFQFLDTFFKDPLADLGEMQIQYQKLFQNYLQFKDYSNGGFYYHKLSLLENDLANLENQNANLINQEKLLERDALLAEHTFDANSALRNEKVISAVDYRNEESKLLGKQLALSQARRSKLQNESQSNEKKKEIFELTNLIGQQKNIFLQAVQTFKSQLYEWKQKYVLEAPISGKVVFAISLQANQQVNQNQILFYISPENTSYYAEMKIPQNNFGKVHEGQKVLLKFPSHPFEEFGMVVGEIEYINKIPSENGYQANIKLKNSLRTNFGITIQFRDGLNADGEIITKNMRLIDRFYYSFIKELHK